MERRADVDRYERSSRCGKRRDEDGRLENDGDTRLARLDMVKWAREAMSERVDGEMRKYERTFPHEERKRDGCTRSVFSFLPLLNRLFEENRERTRRLCCARFAFNLQRMESLCLGTKYRYRLARSTFVTAYPGPIECFASRDELILIALFLYAPLALS